MTLAKTETGQRVLKDRSVALSPRQRAAFILFDGHNTADQVLASTRGMGVTREDIDQLVQLGLLEEAATQPAALASPDGKAAGAARTAQQRYQDAYPIATRLTAGLGLRGLRLNLAVEQAMNYEQLRELAPRIRDAVGDADYEPLDDALNG